MHQNIDIWLIHCAGKVGSVSLTRALRDAGLIKRGAKVYKTHLLSPEKTEESAVNSENQGHLKHSREFMRRFKADEFNHCCVIIGQRDPISQAISAFFQNITSFMGKDVINKSDFKSIMEKVRKVILAMSKFNATTWWKKEVAGIFDFDVFSFPFDKQSGVSYFHASEKLTFLLYTVERGLQNISPTLETLSGVSPITIPHINKVAEKSSYKPYSNNEEIEEIYHQVLNDFRLPIDHLKEVYRLQSCTFFYDANQIDGFIDRWRD